MVGTRAVLIYVSEPISGQAARAYAQWDVSELFSDKAGVTLASITLTPTYGGTGYRYVNMRKVLSTWPTGPGPLPTLSDPVVANFWWNPGSPNVFSGDSVVAMVQDWIVLPNYGAEWEGAGTSSVCCVCASSRYQGGGYIWPKLDVTYVEDTIAPTVTFTTPPDDIHWDGAAPVRLSGTAVDDGEYPGSKVTLVEVRIDSAGWNNASYNPTTHVWTYDWTPPTDKSYLIEVRATDLFGNIGYASRTITVESVSVIYVSPNGDDTKDGLTWANAKKHVQAGIDTAYAQTPKYEVWVKEGVYNDEQNNISLKNEVAAYGGFAGNETYREQRNWILHEAILDGRQAGTTVTADSACTSPLTRIDGFTIQNGCYYGGVYVNQAAPTIANNTVTNNDSEWGGGGISCVLSAAVIAGNIIKLNTATVYAGGIECMECSSPVICGNTVENNDGGWGGGISCRSTAGVIAYNVVSGNSATVNGGGLVLGGSEILSQNTIKNNTASNLGGGIFCGDNQAVISDCFIEGNQAAGGGGVYVFSADYSTLITGCSIEGNSARAGGGVYCEGPCLDPSIPRVVHNPTLTGNTIAGNSATVVGSGEYEGRGGGIFCYRSGATISDNIIGEEGKPNTAQVYGGGICAGINSEDDPGDQLAPTILHNTIQYNQADWEGGGVHCQYALADIERNTFDSNVGTDHGGGVALHGCISADCWVGMAIRNNLFVHNHTDGDLTYLWGGGAVHVYASRCDIVNNTFVENWVGTGVWPNIDPQACGGAIHTRDGDCYRATALVNNIFAHNRALRGNSAAATEVWADVWHCDAWPGDQQTNYYSYPEWCFHYDDGCRYLDPGFFDPDHAKYWLRSDSLLRQTGNHGLNPDQDPRVPTADIGAHVRPGLDGHTDMGAYESDDGNWP